MTQPMEPTIPALPITSVPDGVGSINVPSPPAGTIPSGLPPSSLTSQTRGAYVPPDLCVGDFKITQDECAVPENTYQASLAAEQLSISGAPVNVFKLLGVHEQGLLVDLTGQGEAIASSGSPSLAFDALVTSWVSVEVGPAVAAAYIGYDFGIRKTSYGQPENAPGINVQLHITSIRLTQGPMSINRARQIRVDRSNGDYYVNPAKVMFTGAGNGHFSTYRTGYEPIPGVFMLTALTATTFAVSYLSAEPIELMGVATVGTQFNSRRGSFTIIAGTIPFAINDTFSAQVELMWYRSDVVNVPDMPVALLNLKQSAPARYWRIVPLMFAGTLSAAPWIVDKVELFDYQATRLDNIQDTLFMENRDRDYANVAVQLKAAYQPFDAQADATKFGFQLAEIYTFTVSYAAMIQSLGRPVVVGDVLELPSELMYDHNLNPVHKFLEVEDVGWSASGYTTGWLPILWKFTAQQLIPSQETRDIVGTVDTQKYTVDDATFFSGIEQIQSAPLTVTEANQAAAVNAVPEKGTNIREEASGTNRFNQPGSYDGQGLYVEDGLPPDGAPYMEGFKLPPVIGLTDGVFYRLNYPPEMNIPPRLYKFSLLKNHWIYVETDRRNQRSAFKPSQLEILNLSNQQTLTTKKL